MDDLRINGSGLGQSLPVKTGQKNAEGGFDALLSEAIGKVAGLQNEAENAIQELASGGDAMEAIIAMEKADMSFQVMVEVRNKLISAYEEVMRMQI